MAHQPPTSGDGRPAVLHVDDNPLILELSGILLSRAGFDVETAESVGSALDPLTATEFDCAVTDYRMPPSDATVLLSAGPLAEREIPVVLFTATDPVSLGAEGVLKQVDEFLRKDNGSDQYGVLADLVGSAIRRADEPEGVTAEATTG